MKNSIINIVKSGVGNIGSVARVLNDLEYESKIIYNPSDFSETKKIILPGVGSFDTFINSLKSKNLFNKIQDLVVNKNYSILGICVGMQSLFLDSEEGSEKGFSFFNSRCKKFDSSKEKVPHIGWNNVKIVKNNKLFDNIKSNYFYFAHSYHVDDINQEFTVTTSEYVNEFVSSVSSKNIYGVQFHPEKSFDQGQQIIKNFLEKC